MNVYIGWIVNDYVRNDATVEAPVYTSPSKVRGTVESNPLPHSVLSDVLIFANQIDIQWYFTTVLICIFLEYISTKGKVNYQYFLQI